MCVLKDVKQADILNSDHLRNTQNADFPSATHNEYLLIYEVRKTNWAFVQFTVDYNLSLKTFLESQNK